VGTESKGHTPRTFSGLPGFQCLVQTVVVSGGKYTLLGTFGSGIAVLCVKKTRETGQAKNL
jgi:hypothetical protein